MHRSGVYTNEEFTAQKNIVNKKIDKLSVNIHDKRNEEFNMDEVLEYCFSFIRETAKTWIGLENQPEKRQRFQKLIFPENIEFSDNKFGTAKLSPIYSLYLESLTNKSPLVTLRGIEPRFKA